MPIVAEIIAVGTELLLGNVANTDAQEISQGLSELGIHVYYHTTVGDNDARLRAAVDIARARADILITTGGLGPTYDDMTKQTMAGCFGLKLVRDERSWERIRAYFANVGHAVTPNNERQAWLPEGCTVMENQWGTAPGCIFSAAGKHVLMLPGPPRECTAMFRHCAMPWLRTLTSGTLVSRNIHIFGMGESAVENVLRDLMETAENPTVAPYAKEGEVMLRVTARADTEEQARRLTEPAVRDICEKLGDVVYGIDAGSLEQRVSVLLRERGLTLASAESCTGGLLGARLTELSGASEVFAGGVVAYAEAAKIRLLSVPDETLRTQGAVSGPVAEAMARGVRERFGADIGVGITGLAGPDGDGSGTPVGVVFVSLCAEETCVVRQYALGAGRRRIRVSAVNRALDMVRRYLLDLPM